MVHLTKTKKIVAILFLSGLLASCQSNDKVIKLGEELDYVILRGPVKELELNTYEVMGVAIKPTKGVLYNTPKKLGGGGGKFFIDKDGNTKHFMRFKDRTKEPKSFVENEYSNGKWVKSIVYDSPDKKKQVVKIERQFDENGHLILRSFYDPSPPYCEDQDWRITSKAIFKNDAYGNTIIKIDSSFSNYDCDDIRIKTSTNKYTTTYKNGRRVENDSYTFDYDSEGNMIRINSKRDSEYTEFYQSGVRKKKFIDNKNYDEFDKDGYTIKSVIAARIGDVYTRDYTKRDSYGNWTKMITYEDGAPYLITERQIIYYE